MSNNQVKRAWHELVVYKNKRNRIIHYHVSDTAVNVVLAVVGKKLGRGPVIFTVTDDCIRVFGSSARLLDGKECTDIDKVHSFLQSLAKTDAPIITNSSDEPHVKRLLVLMTRFSALRHRQLDMEAQISNKIVWLGDAWICSKQLKHYPALCRNETKIPIHSMVWAYDDESRKYIIGYVTDLYENEKGEKRVCLAKFLLRAQAERFLPDVNPECREVIITNKGIDITAYYVDGLAMVLASSHFERCEEVLPLCLSFKCFICHRQLKSANDDVTHFSINKLPGYSSQPIFSALEINVPAGPSNTPPKTAAENIELLAQDIGTRGCWFRCKVLRFITRRLKVQYYDVEDAVTHGKLEEWVAVKREADPDRMGLRRAGRRMIRPWPHWDSSNAKFKVGTAVDAWWCNGRWEGFVFGANTSTETKLHIFFPGEKRFRTMEKKDLRISKDWVNRKWVDLITKPDHILSVITSMIKPTPNVSLPPANSPLPDSSQVKGTPEAVVNQQLPSSSESNKPAHIIELLKIKQNEDWTPKGSRKSHKDDGNKKNGHLAHI